MSKFDGRKAVFPYFKGLMLASIECGNQALVHRRTRCRTRVKTSKSASVLDGVDSGHENTMGIAISLSSDEMSCARRSIYQYCTRTIPLCVQMKQVPSHTLLYRVWAQNHEYVTISEFKHLRSTWV